MLKVLLVDDEPFIIQGLKVLIDWENEEFEIAGTASNGKEALQFLENENVDLVIADIRMPEMTGLELLETLRKDKKYEKKKICKHAACGYYGSNTVCRMWQ